MDFTLDRVKAGGYTVACRDRRHLPQASLPAAARVAQLVEQRIENPRVGGSSPPPGTIFQDSRSVGRGSSDCFQTINVLEQELVFPWCG